MCRDRALRRMTDKAQIGDVAVIGAGARPGTFDAIGVIDETQIA